MNIGDFHMQPTDEKTLERFTVSVASDLFHDFENLREKLDLSRSQAIRKAMHLFLDKEAKLTIADKDKEAQVLGNLTCLMRHSHSNIHAHPHPHPHPHEEGEKGVKEKDADYYIKKEEAVFLHSNDVQHHFHDVIVSVTHIHASFDLCLEILVVKGNLARIKELYHELQALQGVHEVNLSFHLLKNSH